MLKPRRRFRHTGRVLAVIGVGTLLVASAGARGDTIQLKNGVVYRGTVDRDNTIVWIYDGLKRIVVRDSKIAKIDSDASLRNLETFRVEQPLVVHGGAMPREVVSVRTSDWNDRGRRTFEYEGAKLGRFIKMEQAINELGPYMVKYRGVDGFWQGQIATDQIPRDIVLGILAKVDRKDQNERIRVARFLIQAEWYAEARAELDQIVLDFSGDADLRERVTVARNSVIQLEAVRAKADIERARAVGQPKKAAALIRTVPSGDVAAEVQAQVRDIQRKEEAQAAADRALATDLQAAFDRLPETTRKTWSPHLLEMLSTLRDAPDAVRDRFVAWRKAKADGGKPAEGLAALAASGYVVGSDAATDDLAVAATLWTMRDQVRGYLSTAQELDRVQVLDTLQSQPLPEDKTLPGALKLFDVVTRLIQRMPPPLHADDPKGRPTPAGPRIHRVRDDDNAEPTEYMVALPPEYHPLRSYPAVVALHDGSGTKQAIEWWSAEAARRGYIVIAPEYRLPRQGNEYHFSTSEHAAVELALRDARRRYAIDSDRVFLGGQLAGGNMAWDFGLAHPDLFAGVIVISGLPFKFVNRYMANAERPSLPLYVALGDLAPAGNEVVFGQMLKPLIARAWDVVYVEYFKRGLETLPEEVGPALDWADRRRRDPVPKTFDALTARPSDSRFFGIVVRETATGRTTAPEAVDPFGKNLNPATIKVKSSALSNLLSVQTAGIKRMDVWISPRVLDLAKRVEIRINNKSFYKGAPRLDLKPLLEDVRLRGDRQQIYWMKVSAG